MYIMTYQIKLKLQRYIKFYLIMVMHIDLLKELAEALITSGSNNNKQVIFKNWAPFNDCINEINDV